MRMTRLILLLSLLLLAACGGAGGADETPATGGELTVDQVTANLSLPTDTGAVYMRPTARPPTTPSSTPPYPAAARSNYTRSSWTAT